MKIKNLLSLAIAASLVLGTSAILSTSAFAQEPEADDDRLLEEVVVTGSAIRRSDLENTLPIQIIDEQMIQQSGVTNTAELLAKVPAMQAFLTPGDSVGGDGGSVRNVNLRGIGNQYTLVLLNGRRIAPSDSGSQFDVQGIPLAAIERVEILTDGASALYGSDAIAGVVNFILKDSVDGTTIAARYDMPEADGGESWNASIVTGFGDIYEDGYSFVFTYQHQEQENLPAVDRDFSETGFIFFNAPGYSDPLFFQNSSPNAIPGNAYLIGADGRTVTRFFNPYAEGNGGTCHEQSTRVDDEGGDGYTCGFDYTSTLQILPETDSDSIYLNGAWMATDNVKLYGTVVYSTGNMTARIAPYPSGRFPLPLDNEFVMSEVVPYMTEEELATTSAVQATWRGIPAGNRTYGWDVDSLNVTLGASGTTGNVDWDAAYTHTESTTDQAYPDGWIMLDPFLDVTGAGLFNPFVYADEVTDEEQEAIDSFVYHGPWDSIETEMNIIQGVGSMPMFEMSGGDAMVAAGFDWRDNSYDRWVAPANLNEELLFLSPDTPYGLSRDQWGAFVETLFPFGNFEATASLRWDDISGVDDSINNEPLDDGDSDLTYKVSAKWDITDWISLRGSYGTGFKAPSMREIGEPLSEFGVTSADYVCPFSSPDPLAEFCIPGLSQYTIFRVGNPDMLFEHSTQYTAGFVLRPTDNFDMTVDYWVIEMEDLVERLTETQIMLNPDTYRHLYTTKTNQATGFEELAIIQGAVNVGSKDSEGIDYNLHYMWVPSWAQIDFNLRGTHMMKSDSSLNGSSLGKYGNDQNVVFDDKFLFSIALTAGNWNHAFIWDYKSSYDDQLQSVELTNQGPPLGQGPFVDVQLKVPSYSLLSYNVRWNLLEDKLGLTFGVNNLLDEEPPLSLRDGGAGHQVGFDPRYTDAYGRTYFLRGEYTF